MSLYLVASLHKSHCIHDCATVRIGLQGGMQSLVLILLMPGKVEGWDLNQSPFKKVFQEELNSPARQMVTVVNTKGGDDGIILLESTVITSCTISDGRLRIRSQLKIVGRKDISREDTLLLRGDNSTEEQYLVVGDRTPQLLIIKIEYVGLFPNATSHFSIVLDHAEFDLFSPGSLAKETTNLTIGLLSGTIDMASHITIIEVDPEKKAVVSSSQIHEISLKTRETGGEVFQEKVYKIFDLKQKCLVMFCSHSLKLFKAKDNNYQKIYSDRFKLPQSEGIFVERLSTHSSQTAVFIMGSYVSASKSTFLYLVEIPANLSLENLQPTYLGTVALLSMPPIILDEKRIFLVSEVEDSEIVDIIETKTKDPRRPFLQTVHTFDNFGILQQIDIDSEKKCLVLNSYKQRAGIQSFQKGLVLEILWSREILSHGIFPHTELIVIQPSEKSPLPSFAFSQPGSTHVFHLGKNHSIYPDNQLQIDSEIFHFQPLTTDLYLLASPTYLRVFKLWADPKMLFETVPPPGHEFISVDSFGKDIVTATHEKLIFYKLNQRGSETTSLFIEHEIKLADEPRFVKITYRRVLVVYWLTDYIDSYTLNGLGHWRVPVQVNGICSLIFFYSKAEDSVFLVGSTAGQAILRIYDKDHNFKASQTVQIGKSDVKLKEVTISQYIAVSDESAIISLAGGSSSVEVAPLCHKDLRDLGKFRYQDQELFIFITHSHLGICKSKGTSLDNYKLKSLTPTVFPNYTDKDKTIDHFISLGLYTLTCSSNLVSLDIQISIWNSDAGLLHVYTIHKHRVEAMIGINFQDLPFVLVGLTVPEDPSPDMMSSPMPINKEDPQQIDNESGALKILQLKNQSLIEVHELTFDKPVRAVQKLEGNMILLCIGMSILRVYRMESRLKRTGDRGIETAHPLLKEVHCQKLYFLVDTISVLDNHILISDYYWMIHVFLFENSRFPRFKPIGRLAGVQQEIVGVELLSPTKFLVSDRADNLLVYSLAEIGNQDTDFIEFQQRNFMCLGEKILSFRHGQRTLGFHFGDPFLEELSKQNKLPFTLMGGCSGGVYVLYEIPRKTFNLLEDLQSSMLAEKEAEFSICLKRKEYRRLSFRNRKTKYSTGIIDADVLFSLLKMPDSQAESILKKMKHVNKPTLSEIRNILRFFENLPTE